MSATFRRVKRLARRVLPHRSRPIEGHRDDQPGRLPEAIKELITEYPLERRRYNQPE
jgi:hypothetical protein